MGRRSKLNEDDVTVHVTPRGGFYVDERELLRSKAAQEMMTKMERILGEELHEREGATSRAENEREDRQ